MNIRRKETGLNATPEEPGQIQSRLKEVDDELVRIKMELDLLFENKKLGRVDAKEYEIQTSYLGQLSSGLDNERKNLLARMDSVRSSLAREAMGN